MIRYRMVVFWEQDDLELDVFANRLSMFLSAMRGTEPALSGWMCMLESERVSVAATEDCRRALDATRVPFPEGSDNVVHKLRLFSLAQEVTREAEPELLDASAKQARLAPPSPGERAAELFLTWGLAPFAELPVWIPNRLDIRLHGGIGARGVDANLAQTLLRTAATTFKADWGVVGTTDLPTLPDALTSSGAPVVGWVTYLCSVYGALPPIEPPALVQPAGDGHLITALQERFDHDDPEHMRLLDKLRLTLRDAGLLKGKRR